MLRCHIYVFRCIKNEKRMNEQPSGNSVDPQPELEALVMGALSPNLLDRLKLSIAFSAIHCNSIALYSM